MSCFRADQRARPPGVQSLSATGPRPLSQRRRVGARHLPSRAQPDPRALARAQTGTPVVGRAEESAERRDHGLPSQSLRAEVFGADFPVRVVRRFAWAHSLEFEPDLAARFRKAPASYPFLVHCAEGTDAAARREVQALDGLGALDQRTAIVHGVGVTPRRSRSDAPPPRFAGLVPHVQPGDARPHRLAHGAALRHSDRAGHRFRAQRSGRSAG